MSCLTFAFTRALVDRPGSSDKPHFFSLERSLCAVSYSQLTQNAAHVILDSPLRQVEILGDLAI